MKKGYILNKATNKKESYFELREVPQETATHKFIEVTGDLPELDREEIVVEVNQEEELIQVKIREMAVAELQKEGKLTMQGKIIKEV